MADYKDLEIKLVYRNQEGFPGERRTLPLADVVLPLRPLGDPGEVVWAKYNEEIYRVQAGVEAAMWPRLNQLMRETATSTFAVHVPGLGIGIFAFNGAWRTTWIDEWITLPSPKIGG